MKKKKEISKAKMRENFVKSFSEWLAKEFQDAELANELIQGNFSDSEFEWLMFSDHRFEEKKKPLSPRDRQRKLNAKRRIQKAAITLLLALDSRGIFKGEEWENDLIPSDILGSIIGNYIEKTGFPVAMKFMRGFEQSLDMWSISTFGERIFKPQIRISMIPIQEE